MKIMKKLLLLLLALPMFATAQEKTVQVPSCEEGSAFTIRIPVRFPDSMAVQYAWYRNDTLVEDSHKLLLGEKAIAYTVPADKAYGNAVYYFRYMLHDDFHEWSHSPRYKLSFQTAINCPAINAPGVISVTDYSCNGISSAGTVSVSDYSCNGISNAGTISVTEANKNGD